MEIQANDFIIFYNSLPMGKVGSDLKTIFYLSSLCLEDEKDKNTLFTGISLFYFWASDLQSSFTFRLLWICI